jgi:hypothetical protein
VSKSGKKRYIRYVACVENKRNVYMILVGDLEGKIPIRRPRYRQDSIKMDLKAIECEEIDWIYLNQDRYKRQAYKNFIMSVATSSYTPQSTRQADSSHHNSDNIQNKTAHITSTYTWPRENEYMISMLTFFNLLNTLTSLLKNLYTVFYVRVTIYFLNMCF